MNAPPKREHRVSEDVPPNRPVARPPPSAHPTASQESARQQPRYSGGIIIPMNVAHRADVMGCWMPPDHSTTDLPLGSTQLLHPLEGKHSPASQLRRHSRSRRMPRRSADIVLGVYAA